MTGETSLIDASIGNTRSTECFLRDDGNEIGEMTDTYDPLLLFPSGGVHITGISDGGSATIACHSSGTSTFAFNATTRLIAIPIGNVK